MDRLGHAVEVVRPAAFDKPDGQRSTAWVVFRSANGGRTKKPHPYFFLSGRCVKADPAAVLDAFPVLPDLRTFDAAVPAFLDVVSFFAIDSSFRSTLGIRDISTSCAFASIRHNIWCRASKHDQLHHRHRGAAQTCATGRMADTDDLIISISTDQASLRRSIQRIERDLQTFAGGIEKKLQECQQGRRCFEPIEPAKPHQCHGRHWYESV